jgi:three-Cys-motif partner protein
MSQPTERSQKFGGPWSLLKVQTVEEYLRVYSTALSKQTFTRIYIDAFAGSGSFSFDKAAGLPKLALSDSEDVVHRGSVKRALDAKPGFNEFYFVDNDQKNLASLRVIAGARSDVRILEGDANVEIPKLCSSLNWRNRRGVIFVDPWGPEVQWPLIESIAATKALDVFFLFPLSAVYRNAPRDHKDLTPEKKAMVTKSLWPGWEEQLYSEKKGQIDLFGQQRSSTERDAGWAKIDRLVTEKMRSIFPHVEEPAHLVGPTSAPLFSLYFAVSNDSPAAIKVASPIARALLNKL